MHILDRLSKDLAELMERELTQPKADPDRLYSLLLLLIGWQRGDGRSTTPSTAAHSSELEMEDDPETGEVGENDIQEEDEDLPEDPAALTLLLRQSPFTHGNPYLSGLLYRDFYAGQTREEKWLPGLGRVRIHTEAALYVEEVLWLKTLGLATRNAGEAARATNLHLLLLRLCRLSRAAGPWTGSELQRRLDGTSAGLDALWFRKTALALRAQVKRLGDRISATSRNRREASGPYWLETGGCAEIVGEELSLGDIAGIAPTPLQPGFAADPEFFELLRAVLQSLNEKYKWLRKCGLAPHDWLHQDEPSISRLKELALLRKRATETEAWTQGFSERAFREAFERVRLELAGKDQSKAKPPKKGEAERKVGGFADFKDWLDSDLGQAMLRDRPVSLSDLLDDDEDFEVEDRHPETPASGADTSELYARILVEAGPRLAEDPVLAIFFREVLVADRPFIGTGSLLEDTGFQALLAQAPDYAGLTVEKLAERLFYGARSLIAEVLEESAETTAPEAVLKYLRWVLIQEKPFKALLKQKAFEAALAREPSLRNLSQEELAEQLQRDAMQLLMRWLDGGD